MHFALRLTINFTMLGKLVVVLALFVLGRVGRKMRENRNKIAYITER